jgi:hypothetical protein
MKIQYNFHDGRGQLHSKQYEVTMTTNEATGQVFMSYPSELFTYNGNKGFCGGSQFLVKNNFKYWQIIKDSMTASDKIMYGKFMSYWREYALKDIRRKNANACFPRHIGKVTDTVNGIGGTYHTLNCDACHQTWNIDSGD